MSESNDAGGEGAPLGEYVEVEFHVSWFPTTKKITGGNADAMAEAVDADPEVLSLSKRLLGSRHPAVKACNDAKRDVHRVFARYTIPKVALARKASGDNARYAAQADAGVRLIHRRLLDRFHADLKEATDRLAAGAVALQAAMPEIVAEAREKQQKVFDASDYDFDPRERIAVDIKVRETAVTADLESLCPELYRQQKALFDAERRIAIEAFADDFATAMAEHVADFRQQLGYRERLDPHPTGPWAEYRDAELIDLVEGEGGLVVARVQKQGTREADRVHLPAMTRADFEAQLRPYTTDEKRQVRAGTIEGLTDLINRFFTDETSFGAYRSLMAERVRAVQSELAQADGNLDSGSIANRVRRNERLRDGMARALGALQQTLDGSVETVRRGRRAVMDNLALDLPVEQPAS